MKVFQEVVPLKLQLSYVLSERSLPDVVSTVRLMEGYDLRIAARAEKGTRRPALAFHFSISKRLQDANKFPPW